MNFEDLVFDWKKFSGQSDSGVTYVIVAPRLIPSLFGESDILYVGYTDNPISDRVEQQTNSFPPTARGGTNTRLTHVLSQLDGWTYFYVDGRFYDLSRRDRQEFNGVMDKWTYLDTRERLTLEKFLLVYYAEDHLELPPLNNSF